jgi:hypothetical protein
MARFCDARLRGHDRAWPSEGRSEFPLPVSTRTSSAEMTDCAVGVSWAHRNAPLLVPSIGACRGAKPICVSSRPPLPKGDEAGLGYGWIPASAGMTGSSRQPVPGIPAPPG